MHLRNHIERAKVKTPQEKNKRLLMLSTLIINKLPKRIKRIKK